MNEQIYFCVIEEELAKLKVLINTDNDLNLKDKNIFLEDAMAYLLNCIYDINLVNTNFEISNYPVIDLKDEVNRVAVQVTTNTTSRKVQKTLDNFFDKEFERKFNKLLIIVFDDKTYSKNVNLKKKFNFNDKEHVITYDKLIKIIKNLPLSKLEAIYKYIDLSLRKHVYNVNWVINNTKRALNNLDKRYNRKLNVYTDEERKLQNFFMLGNCKDKIIKVLNKVICLIENEDIKTNITLDDVIENFTKDNLNKLKENLKTFGTKVIEKYESSDKRYGRECMLFEDKYSELMSSLKKLENAYFAKAIIYKGSAGIGKSHTIASFINERYIKEEEPALLVLGQDFGNSDNIEVQFCKIIGANNDLNEVLCYLDFLGKIRGIIVPIIIDGLNESVDKTIWKKGLSNFIECILKYENIKIILSIRDTYFELCTYDGILDNPSILKYDHNGFNTNKVDAVKEFFDYYNINMPLFETINNEFENPLFLTTYCLTVTNCHIKVGENEYNNFIEIFDAYIEMMNKKFFEKENLSISSDIVSEAINLYIRKWQENKRRLSEKEFLSSLKEICDLYDIRKVELLQFLIENGLFYKERTIDGEVIMFTYERYEKICFAKKLLASFDLTNTDEELKKSINSGKLMEYVFYDYNNTVFDEGILEELVNIIQLIYGFDFYSLIEMDKVNDDIKKIYIKNLIWYKGQYNSNIVINNIKKINQNNKFTNEIIDVFIKSSYLLNNPLNIIYLNQYLLKYNMPELDYNWSIPIISYYLNYSREGIDKITEYCLIYGNGYLDNNSKYLVALLFSWLLSSSDRYLRDRSTKALTKVLLDSHDISIKLLENFKNEEDMYILERIVAAIYGSIVRSENNSFINELSQKLYDWIYKRKKTLDNIVIKIYAKKLFAYLKRKFNISLYDNIKNEQKSLWYSSLPTNDEIDKYEYDENKSRIYANCFITRSMVTEYGRGTCGYGDFGRYVLEGFLHPFEYIVDNVQLLANVATKRVFELGYNYELFKEFDENVKKNMGNDNSFTERIGKKYQWIATYELLAKLYDNFNPSYSIDYDEIINLDKWKYLDKNYKETKKISKVKYASYDLDEITNNLLTIDTTNLIFKNKKQPDSVAEDYFKNNKFDIDENTDYSKYVIKEANGNKYIALYKRFFVEDRQSYLKNVDRNSFLIACTAVVFKDKQNLHLSDCDEYVYGTANEQYNMQLFDIPYSSEYELSSIMRYQNQNLESSYLTCYENYIYEKIYDDSTENSCNILIPQKWIIEAINLEHKDEKTWYKGSNLICHYVDYDDGNIELLIKYDDFIDYLAANKLQLAWIIFCQKGHNFKKNIHRVKLFYDMKKKNFDEETIDKENLEQVDSSVIEFD